MARLLHDLFMFAARGTQLETLFDFVIFAGTRRAEFGDADFCEERKRWLATRNCVLIAAPELLISESGQLFWLAFSFFGTYRVLVHCALCDEVARRFASALVGFGW